MSDDAQEWRWVGEDGVEKAVSEQELIAELSSESLPHYTLVWKKRWLEWLPAMQVAELGWALPPGKADRTVKARERASAVTPPPPPLYRYPVIKRRAASLRGDTPPPAPSPLASAGAGAPTVDDAATAGLRPQSKSVEDVEIDAIASSSPFAAVGPISGRPESDPAMVVGEADLVSDTSSLLTGFEPPRLPFGATSYTEDDDGDTHILPSRPPGPVYVGPHAPPPSESAGPVYDENEIPRIPRPPASPTDLSAYARFSPLSEEPPSSVAERPRPRRKMALAAGAAGIGIVAALLVLKGFSGGAESEGETPSAKGAAHRLAPQGSAKAAAASEPEEPRPTGPPCAIATPALRVAGWAEPLVTPTLAAIPGSARVAVGFAQSSSYAVGITIDPRTLDRDQVFREFRREKLLSVVPTSAMGKLRFELAREGFTLANARAVDAPTPLFIGATPFSIARLVDKGEPEPIWPLAEAEQSSVPRITPLTNGGYAVALRHGGKNAVVSVGYVDAGGAKRSELADVRAEGSFVGTPSLAASDDGLLVAFAARATQGSPWGIVAATAKLGESPHKAARLRVRRGGPGGDHMSPSVGALNGGRWIVQWTEGSAGNRMARAQVFGADLTPRSEVVNLSPDGANAGQGVVWTSGDLATILFFVKNDKNNNELWGVSLECPR